MSIEWKSGNKCLYNQTDCLSGVEFNFTLIYQGPLRFDQKKKERKYTFLALNQVIIVKLNETVIAAYTELPLVALICVHFDTFSWSAYI